MKFIIVLSALVAVAVAGPVAGSDASAEVLRSENENIGLDSYRFSYETSNGISADEQGQLTNAGSENEAISVRGQFSYTAADGKRYLVNYVADENGFQPSGEHLPKHILP